MSVQLLAAIVAAIQAPVVLEEHAVRPRARLHDLVHALAELGMLVGQELGAHTAVGRPPRRPAVVARVHAARRDRDGHPRRVGGIEHDRVQAEAAAARLPLRPVRVVPQAVVQRPRLAAVVRREDRGRFDAAVERVGLRGARRNDLPDLLQRGAAGLGKLDVRAFGIGPGAAEVVAGLRSTPPQCMLVGPAQMRCRPVAPVVGQRVDRAAGEVRAADIPRARACRRARRMNAPFIVPTRRSTSPPRGET